MRTVFELSKLLATMAILCVVSILLSAIVIQVLFDLMNVQVTFVWSMLIGCCVGISVTVLYCCTIAFLFHLQYTTFARALAPLKDLKAQIDSLDLKIPDGLESLDTLTKLEERIRMSTRALEQLDLLVANINQQSAVISEKESEILRRTIAKQLEGVAMEFNSRGFTLVWNSLPYHQYFDKMDNDDKVAYFNAIQTGNWQPLRRRYKSKWKN